MARLRSRRRTVRIRRFGQLGVAIAAAVISLGAFALRAPGPAAHAKPVANLSGLGMTGAAMDVGALPRLVARTQAAGSADDDRVAFLTYCVACHGVAGEGIEGLGVNLAESSYVASTGVAGLVKFLKVGRLPNDPASVSGRPMPGFAYVDEAELAAIARYLKQLRDG